MESGKAKAIKAYSMEKEGCEIEARGISYKIYTPKKTHPFKIWSREEEPEEDQQQRRLQQSIEEDTEMQVRETLTTTTTTTATRHVLKNVSCRAKPWEILAIVGPSGAGKSTLLEILAGKLLPQASTIFVNKKPIDKAQFKKISGYVTQKDMLFPLLTVEETLMFSAKLRLRLPPSQLASRVESLIQELGLSHVAGDRVGDDKLRGISGGERRRVSIGVDVIHDPRVLILDEPTSGLDSTSALQIIDMLKTMAEVRGRTIILSIHQPGFRIVKLFNSILLLANGSVLHHGTTDQLQSHMRLIGLHLPLHVNVIEFAIDAIETLQRQQQQQLLQQQNKGDDGRTGKCTLQQLFQLSKVLDEEIAGCNDLHCSFANSRIRETVILTHRFSKIVYRTKELFALRTLQMLVAGLVLGSIFFHLDFDEVGIEERVGLFAFILTFLLSCTTEALPIFLQEREILMKETSCGSYRISSYVIANSLVFLPFLLILAVLFSSPLYWLVGLNRSFASFMYFLLVIWMILYTANSVVVCFSALVPNFIVGNSLISGVMGSFFLFSGYFISKEGMPNYWIFMHYLSLFKYPFEGFLVNEFCGSGKCLEYLGEVCVMSGEDVLREEGLGEESRWKNVLIMACFILAYRFFSYVILRCRCSQRCLRSALV
ncbi:ABC transporter G family member 5 [Magnolia sinica]|uniref:ABC transporter G family member 5 n=1 Tax=Magnolia sinica TaxID=86752 RepID=UPI00265AE760|nr:ABC transporter G family member 5 [Magnolia sinica]